MADTKTEKTVADELKRAVKSLRCEEHSHPCNPPEGTILEPGPCRHCGAPWPKDDDGMIPEALREPLASWLESWDGIELREDGPLPDDFQHALRIARVLNGTAS